MQPPLVRPHLAQVSPYIPGKGTDALERRRRSGSVANLASNESAMGPSPLALAAIRTATPSLHRYPETGTSELCDRIALLHGVAPDEVVLGNGSGELIDMLTRTFASPAHHGVVGVPSFPAYALALSVNAVAVTRVPLVDGRHWNPDDLLAAIEPHTRLLFVDNPNNPTSTHLPGDALAYLLRSLPEHVVPVIDEAYVHYVTAQDFVSAIELRELNPRTVVLRTFSKVFGLAALRAGYAIAHADFARELRKVPAPFHVNGLAQAAARAALDDVDHVERVVTLNARERVRLSHALGELGLSVAPSQANFLYVELPPGCSMDAGAVCAALREQDVLVRDTRSPRHWRMTLGLEHENDQLLQALAALPLKGPA